MSCDSTAGFRAAYDAAHDDTTAEECSQKLRVVRAIVLHHIAMGCNDPRACAASVLVFDVTAGPIQYRSGH